MKYFSSLTTLATALRDESLAEHEKVKYLAGSFVLTVLIGSLSPITFPRDFSSALAFIAYLALITGGVLLCYLENRAGDDRNFIERFICLGLPILVRWYVLYYVLYLLVAGITNVAVGWDTEEFARFIKPAYPAVVAGLQLWYYLWLRKYVRIAASGTAPGS